MNIRRLTVAVMLLLTSVVVRPTPLLADEALEREIRKLIEITDLSNLTVEVVRQVSGQIKAQVKELYPQLSDAYISALVEEINVVYAETAPEMMESYIKLYARYFTVEEIEALIRFYETPAGRKTLQVMPSLLREATEIGAKWGEAFGALAARRVTARMRRDGYKL